MDINLEPLSSSDVSAKAVKLQSFRVGFRMTFVMTYQSSEYNTLARRSYNITLNGITN